MYWIGGSPCCGKSTVAERLAEAHGQIPYKLDDFLTPYMERMAQGGHALCKAALGYSMEQMWMREPAAMCREEMQIYRDMFPLVREALDGYPADAVVIAEGAGLLPEMLHAQGVAPARYLCMTPTREFQRRMYAQRPWISHYLAACSDPEQAFSNWMERDALFGEAVRTQAQHLGYRTILVDGSVDIDGIFRQVGEAFGL